jgi:hypothetical integral membrane protein (TIGR02206 family)
MDTFSQGSTLHFLSLGVCLVAVLFTIGAAVRVRDREASARPLRLVIATGCLLSWIVSNGYGIFPERFSWSESLPLHFCNLANLIGAHAVATRHRISQALIYFWSIALCSCAFLTPSLYVGPAHLWFWLFWIYHAFIPVSVAWILVADRFRPSWPDWRNAVVLTLGFMAVLVALDAITGWNYGFVGPSLPTQKNILDFLGPYPLRLFWMALIGAFLFTLLMIPWLRPLGTSAPEKP